MRVNIMNIAKTPGSWMHIECRMNPADLGERIEGLGFVGEIVLRARASNIDKGLIELSGKVGATLETQCARCLLEVPVSIDADFSEKFARFSESDDAEVYVFSEDMLELDDLIMDYLLLNAPMRSLCSPDCKGLCPSCGSNLNYTQCNCLLEGEDVANGHLDALQALICNDEEV